MLLVQDKTGELERVYKRVVEKYEDDFGFLANNSNFLFTWRDREQLDDEGKPIAATARVINKRERDLYGYDFEINAHKEYFDELSETEKDRLIYHELLHCVVLPDEENPDYPATDNDGRNIIFCQPHDVIIRTFKKEIERFGLRGSDIDTAKFLAKQYRNYIKRELKEV